MRASIIISSYNYGRFLGDCIESALNQTYPDTEVIVVDDASTDNSREIILGYGTRLIPVLRQKNEGGRATYNAACALTNGDVLFILDSDDMLCPSAVERAVELFDAPDVVKVHWPMWKIDTHGRKTGEIDPCPVLPEGNFQEQVIRDGPFAFAFPSTSGNAYSRAFLEKVLPLPNGVYGDAYLATWALVSGKVKRILEPQGYYRLHGGNTYAGRPFLQRVERDLRHAELCCNELSKFFQQKGIAVDIEIWRKNSWYHRLYESTQQIMSLVDEAGRFILVDEDNWGTCGSIAGRTAIPFPEYEGEYGGHPADDATALNELKGLLARGPSHIVFAWTAFWWLEYYPALHNYLRSNFRCVLENDQLVVFDLRREAAD